MLIEGEGEHTCTCAHAYINCLSSIFFVFAYICINFTMNKQWINFTKTECGNYTYGSGCSNKCGKCNGGITCNHINGSCPNNCAAGRYDDKCDKGKKGSS